MFAHFYSYFLFCYKYLLWSTLCNTSINLLNFAKTAVIKSSTTASKVDGIFPRFQTSRCTQRGHTEPQLLNHAQLIQQSQADTQEATNHTVPNTTRKHGSGKSTKAEHHKKHLPHFSATRRPEPAVLPPSTAAPPCLCSARSWWWTLAEVCTSPARASARATRWPPGPGRPWAAHTLWASGSWRRWTAWTGARRRSGRAAPCWPEPLADLRGENVSALRAGVAPHCGAQWLLAVQFGGRTGAEAGPQQQQQQRWRQETERSLPGEGPHAPRDWTGPPPAAAAADLRLKTRRSCVGLEMPGWLLARPGRRGQRQRSLSDFGLLRAGPQWGAEPWLGDLCWCRCGPTGREFC